MFRFPEHDRRMETLPFKSFRLAVCPIDNSGLPDPVDAVLPAGTVKLPPDGGCGAVVRPVRAEPSEKGRAGVGSMMEKSARIFENEAETDPRTVTPRKGPFEGENNTNLGNRLDAVEIVD